MNESKVLISVVIPTCHRNDLLAKCLDCLAPEVQTLAATEYEVIVSDDGSQTTAEAMMREQYPWAKWVAGPRKGPAANRNKGAEQARGEWLAFTDDDCLPEPQWLAAYAEQTDASRPVLEGKTTTEPTRGLFYTAPTNTTGGYLWSCNMMLQKAVFQHLGGFDDKFPFPHLEDVEFRVRLQDAGHELHFVPEAVVFHPLRPIISIMKQTLAHESDWYMSRKHHLPLRYFQLHPLLYWKSQLRLVIRDSRSPSEALRFLITRSCVEAALLIPLAFRWNRKYKKVSP